MKNTKATREPQYSFGEEIQSFIDHIDSLVNTLPLVVGNIESRLIDNSKKMDKFLGKRSKKDKEEGKYYEVKVDEMNEFEELLKNIKSAEIAYKLLPKNFIVSLVSQYDAYLGCLIRTMYYAKPELTQTIDKSIKYSDLLSFKTVDEIKEEIIEKDVESVLRENHYQQLKCLEYRISNDRKKFTLTKDLEILPTFIEVCERRNLFVHCNGVVSRQYLNVCKSHNVIGINKTKLNQELEVNPKYAEKSYQTVFEIGVKLGHVLWRKLQPDVRLIADKHLINCCYDLIESEQYELATAMLKFATEEIKQHADEEVKKILIINKALNYYLQGKSQTCKKELGDTDWSATNDKFKLAVSVLNEQYNDSVLYMKNIGPNHKDIGKNEYQTWPLFKKFRTTADFQKTYKDIFNEDFKIIEKQPKEFVRLIKSLEGKEKQQQPTKHKAKRVSRKKKQ